jgi:antitoxin (DNA-binding transcriptional repressor) of toxin-antitoxin stability system
MKYMTISLKQLVKYPRRTIYKILAKESDGNEFLLTHNGKAVAKIVPLSESEIRQMAMLARSFDLLGMRPSAPTPMWLPEGMTLEGEGLTASEMILEDRK